MVFSGRQLPSKKKGGKNVVRPGKYDSDLKEVKDNPDYETGVAVDIFYELTKDGKSYPFKETFIIGYYNERTEKFDQYLCDNGVDTSDLANLVGVKEKVTLKKVPTSSGAIFVNIVEREFMR